MTHLLQQGYVTAPEHHLRRVKRHQQNLLDNPVGAPGAAHEKAQLLSNKTHYNPHDPDARISVKPGKARKLNYHCSMAVDTAEGVISHIQADFADGRDSQYLRNISMQVQNRLKRNELAMTDLLADAGYTHGSNYNSWNKEELLVGYQYLGSLSQRSKAFHTTKKKINIAVR